MSTLNTSNSSPENSVESQSGLLLPKIMASAKQSSSKDVDGNSHKNDTISRARMFSLKLHMLNIC